MKKDAAKSQKKEIKPVVNVKRKPGKQVNSKKTGSSTVKKLAVGTELPPDQQAADAAIVPPSLETDVCHDSTGQVEVVAEIELAEITEESPEPQIVVTNSTKPQTESKVLRERLGLNGYCTETIKLSAPIEVLGCKAEGVVFAKQIEGVDRVLLHIMLFNDSTKRRSIVSSKQKVPLPEWQTLTDALTGMAITWRDRESKRAAK